MGGQHSIWLIKLLLFISLHNVFGNRRIAILYYILTRGTKRKVNEDEERK